MARFPASWPKQTRTYAAMVELMDGAFGAVVGALREARMLRRALLTFMSDNGGPMIPPACNGGLRGGKGTPYEGGVRAPAFVHWPACLGETPRAARSAAHMVDVFRTLSAAAGAAPRGGAVAGRAAAGGPRWLPRRCGGRYDIGRERRARRRQAARGRG